MEKLLGFHPAMLLSWNQLVRILNQPQDGSILAYMRMAFGILMMIDIPQERGMTVADEKYGEQSKDVCRFPVFDWLHPLDSDGMVVLYAVLFLSACGIAIGCFYRLCCLLFTVIYWYFFLLDKGAWNNHSYLYGLLGFLFLITDAHRYASVDGLLRKSIRNSQVPLWNYAVLRFQIFFVYFCAGLKKTDSDWLFGYSMTRLSKSWVFNPVRILLDEAMIDFLVVHLGGFLFDISVGFLLFFDQTRLIGFVMCSAFHLMNSQIFSIGMFPYAMLATMFVFCYADSFKRCIGRLPTFLQIFDTSPASVNPSCLSVERWKNKSSFSLRWKHHFATALALLYVCEQLFLPFSHFITKGYNGWTDGPYGYSWDMMVHNFQNQHAKISYKDKYGTEGYLKPGAFAPSSKRWSLHPDMAIQYARCLKERLIGLGIEEPSVHFDVWRSMNQRFQQRVFDPRMDLASYDWSPFETPKFVLPLLSELTDWRGKLQSLKKDYRDQTLEVTFVADFPGMSLENFVQKDYGNATLEVLNGVVSVELESAKENVTLSSGQKFHVPPGKFHIVRTTSDIPSCYFYIYVNTTDIQLQDQIDAYAKRENGEDNSNLNADKAVHDEDRIAQLYKEQEAKKKLKQEERTKSLLERLSAFAGKKYSIFKRSFLTAVFSTRNIFLGRPNATQLNNERAFLWSLTAHQNAEQPKNIDKRKSEL